eukprot:TRINITY_DN13446_c0_g1_i1.p1 TRINITY_DN13446_c0_g1~~TRINITY_DN13446_c0_g1_i1.p1  ORF type:complete len:254 (+),score=47.41 TRINITY_DN13446_c0_g1_i1:77-838(+)
MSHDDDDDVYEDLGYTSYYTPSEIYPFLYLGDATHATERRILDQFNIRYIVNCANDVESAFLNDPDFRYLNIQVSDEPSSYIATHFENAFEFLDQAKDNYDKAVQSGDANPPRALVHCMAGISRSATVVIAYCMRTHKMPLKEAVKFVKKHRSIIHPNPGFLTQLSLYEVSLGLATLETIVAAYQKEFNDLCGHLERNKRNKFYSLYSLRSVEAMVMALEAWVSSTPQFKEQASKLVTDMTEGLNTLKAQYSI